MLTVVSAFPRWTRTRGLRAEAARDMLTHSRRGSVLQSCCLLKEPPPVSVQASQEVLVCFVPAEHLLLTLSLDDSFLQEMSRSIQAERDLIYPSYPCTAGLKQLSAAEIQSKLRSRICRQPLPPRARVRQPASSWSPTAGAARNPSNVQRVIAGDDISAVIYSPEQPCLVVLLLEACSHEQDGTDGGRSFTMRFSDSATAKAWADALRACACGTEEAALLELGAVTATSKSAHTGAGGANGLGASTGDEKGMGQAVAIVDPSRWRGKSSCAAGSWRGTSHQHLASLAFFDVRRPRARGDRLVCACPCLRAILRGYPIASGVAPGAIGRTPGEGRRSGIFHVEQRPVESVVLYSSRAEVLGGMGGFSLVFGSYPAGGTYPASYATCCSTPR